MNKYSMNIVLEPHIKEASGRRYLIMDVDADDEEQAKDFAKQMIKPLLNDGVKLFVSISK